MTTNAGAWDLAKPAIGFGSGVREGDDQEAINRMFTPEFRNRLDAVISFAPLSAGYDRTGRRQIRAAARRAARRPQCHDRARRQRAGVARRKGLRPALRRPPARPGDPGAHQKAARRGAAVRAVVEGRDRPRDAQTRRGRALLLLRRAPGRTERQRSPSWSSDQLSRAFSSCSEEGHAVSSWRNGENSPSPSILCSIIWRSRARNWATARRNAGSGIQ